MRILMITHGIYPLNGLGGVELYTSEVAQILSKQHDLTVLVFSSDNFSDKTIPYRQYIENINVLSVPGSRNHLPDKNFGAIDFHALLEILKPDLIYIMSTYRLPSQLFKDVNIPYILHLHDFSLICPRIILRQKNEKECKGPKLWHCAKCLGKIKQPISFFNKMLNFNNRITCAQTLIKNARAVLCVSEHVAKFYSKYGLTREQVICTPPIQVNKAAYPAIKRFTGVLRIGFLSGSSEHKGIKILAETIRILRFPWRLEIYNITKEKQKNNVFQLFKGFEERTHIKGVYKPNMLDRIFSEIDILVVPSICPETYCRVIDEALARKVIVIASDFGGMAERLVDGVNAFLVQPENAKSLAEKLSYINSNFEAVQNKTQFNFNPLANKNKEVILNLCHAIDKDRFVNGFLFERINDVNIISRITEESCQDVERRLLEELKNPGSTVNAAWIKSGSPKNPDDIFSFYRFNDAYLYDLLVAQTGHTAWERNQWRRVALSALHRMGCISLLDYGAGIGWDSIFFAKSGINVSHFDVNELSRQFAKFKSDIEGIRINIISDINLLKEASFDAVYCTEVLKYLPNHKKVLEHIYRLLKPGAYLFATESFGATVQEYFAHLPENSIYSGSLGSIGNEIGFRLCQELSVPSNRLYILKRN